MNFEPAWPEHGVVDHVLADRGADHQHVLVRAPRAAAAAVDGVELVEAVDLGQQLVHHRVSVRAPRDPASDAVHLAEIIFLAQGQGS